MIRHRRRAGAGPAAGWLRGYLAFSRTPAAIGELDGLRAFAILLVLARHAVRPFWLESAPLFPVMGWDAAGVLINGWIGVDLFFVLSGFLITHHLLRRWGGELDASGLRTYLAKRVLRIVPAYYAVLFVVALGWVPDYAPGPELLAARVAYHMAFLQDYLPSNIVVAFWSLGVEEKFYLLAPLVLIWVVRLNRPGWRYAAVAGLALVPLLVRVLTLGLRPEITTYEAFFPLFRSPFQVCFDGLALGMLCALLCRGRARIAWMRAPWIAGVLFWAGAAAVAVFLAGGPLLDRGVGAFEKTAMQSLLALAMAAVLLGTLLGGGPAAVLRSRPLLFLSRLSYSLYLVHLPLVPAVRLALDGAVGLDRFEPWAQAAIFMPAFAAVSLGAALLLDYLVEKPFLLLKDRPRPAVAGRTGAASASAAGG
jgi:peptidoglycan/LPS O-acetylase OafA/YrhL